MLPPFGPNGRLPVGVHPATWPVFVERFGTSTQRREQLTNLEAALRLLRDAGCVGAEFFPAQLAEGLTGRSFLRFFQYTRDDEPVGIVVIDLDTIP